MERLPLQICAAALAAFLPSGLCLGQDKPATDVVNPIELEASVVSATPPPVKVAQDTLVFSTGAYRLEDDASLEDFLKKIPGLELDGSAITLYGKRINKLLVNGKVYFGGDVATGLRSISAEDVENVQTYEMLSDYARLSGVDDGEEEQVLDVKIKKKAMGQPRAQTGAGYGTSGRYRGNVNLTRMDQRRQATLSGTIFNTPTGSAITNTSGSQMGAGSDGDASHRNAGADWNSSSGDTEINAHIKYNGADRLQERVTHTQNIRAGGNNFAESTATTLAATNNLTAQAQIEWRPRKNLTIMAKPSFGWNGNNSWSNPLQQTYASDPALPDARLLNTVAQSTSSYRSKIDGGLVLLLSRRFDKRGRNASLRVQGSLSGDDSYSFNDYEANYSKREPSMRKQYIEDPVRRSDVSVQGSWSEPVGRRLHLQLTLSGRLQSTRIGRNFYSMEAIAGDWTVPRTMSRKSAAASLPEDYAATLYPTFTSSGTYSARILSGIASLRYSYRKFNATAGVSVRPYWSDIRYTTATEPDGHRSRFVCYAAPNLSLRYARSRTDALAFTYRSWTNAPSPERLLPVRNGTNPLVVRTGNPDLLPAFVQRLSLSYNHSDPGGGNSIVLSSGVRISSNDTATMTSYDDETGGRTISWCNVDGNWSADASAVWNHRFRGTPLSIVNTAAARYAEDVSYLYNNALRESQLNTNCRLMLKDRAELKADWGRFDITARVGAEYTDERSLLREDLRQQPWVFLAGGEAGVTLPRRWKLSSDLSCLFQRGYAYSELNTDFFLWNASVSKTLFKGRATMRLNACDLLGQQVNMTRRFGANTRQVSVYNGVGRYVMLHFVWRFRK